jgi:hypothetical protein
MKSPDLIHLEYQNKTIEIKIETIEDYVVIRGNKDTLEFIGKLILAQSAFKEDDSYFIHPNGAGNKFFSKESKLGIYIKRED